MEIDDWLLTGGLSLLPQSYNFEKEGPSLPNGAIGGVAGINTSFEVADQYATLVQQMAEGAHILWTHNVSYGVLVDLTVTSLLAYNNLSFTAQKIIQHWEHFANTHRDPMAKYLQICHSGGASHVRCALERITPELRERIIVLALAPAEIVPKALCHQSYNYASAQDVIYYGKMIVGLPRIQNNLELLEELEIVMPHEAAEVFDHAFLSPTLLPILERHIKAFIQGEVPDFPNTSGLS